METSVQLVGLNKASFDAAAQQKFQRGVADTLGESVSATDVEILTVNEVPMASGRRLVGSRVGPEPPTSSTALFSASSDFRASFVCFSSPSSLEQVASTALFSPSSDFRASAASASADDDLLVQIPFKIREYCPRFLPRLAPTGLRSPSSAEPLWIGYQRLLETRG